jgi:hypothetical protein
MRLFLDSSALLKRYIPEPGTDRVIALCAQAREMLLSTLAPIEVISAFSRLRRLKAITDDEYNSAKQKLMADLQNATVMELRPSVGAGAIVCLERSPLRASDAIHVATALECSPDLFLSADHRQCEAARTAGLKVEEITP